jgi:LmeA-like phospholipid-binding
MRKLLIAVAVLVLLGAGADFAAARIFEDRVTEALQREYDLGKRPVVQVRDVPFLPRLATGRFSTIDVAATDATARGVNAAQLKLTLHGVRVPPEVMLGEPGAITVDRADGTIELTEAEVNRLLADRLQGGSVAIKEDGVEVRSRVEFLGQPLDALVTGELGAREGGVTFTPSEVRLGEQGRIDPSAEDLLASRFTFQVPLPDLPAGVRLERVDTRPGTLVLSGRAAAVRVDA